MLGRIVVVAGETQALAVVAADAVAAGASVAVVSHTLSDDVPASLRFRANPADPAVWDRVAMHIEQHLGPVDGVATDEASYDVVSSVFAEDLVRRGHGAVVSVSDGDEPSTTLTRLGCRPATTPPRPAAADRDR